MDRPGCHHAVGRQPALQRASPRNTQRNLERDGLVSRTVTPSSPPRVDYELTALGHSLVEPLRGIEQWALDHVEDIDEAHAAFDAERDVSEAA